MFQRRRLLSRPLLSVSIILSSLAGSSAFAADARYRDPHQPSFTLVVPDGWTAAGANQGVNIRRGTSYADLLVTPGAMEPGAMLVQIRSQFERQWKIFRELGSGEAVFGGQKGAYAIYAGVPPSGVSGITKVVTMTTGRMTYALFLGAHLDEYARVKQDMERIEASFTPEMVR